MANKITNRGGTDWSDGDILYSADVLESIDSNTIKFYSDNTGGNHTGDTDETDLATLTITQNDMGSDFSLQVVSGIHAFSANTGNAAFKLYVNGSVVKTITLSIAASSAYSEPGTAFTYYGKNLDSTAGNIIVKVSVTNSTSSVNSKCDGIIVTALNRSD